MRISIIFFSIIFLMMAIPCQSNEVLNFSINPSWDSRYVTEGADNLDSGGLFSIDLTLSNNAFSFGLWLAKGDSEDYKEINLYVEYVFLISDVEGYLNLTHLLFPEEANNEDQDNEIGFGLSYNPCQWLQPAVDYAWSSEQKSGYVEFSLISELLEDESQYQITPYLLRSYDFGYVSKDYDGVNHTEVGLELSTLISANTTLQLGLYHSWAGANLERDDLDDESWLNIGLSVEI